MFALFFQAEDGIRDIGVTGVQTCALPIWPGGRRGAHPGRWRLPPAVLDRAGRLPGHAGADGGGAAPPPRPRLQIGRASCRARVSISVVAVLLKKNKNNSRLDIPDS